MNTSKKGWRIGGWVLHGLIASMMIFAGSVKVFGFAPPELVSKMNAYGLGSQLRLIGTGELITAILLLIPRTSSLGVLLTSSFRGGVICLHMAHGEFYALPSVLLVLTWVGAYLRNPEILSSFSGSPRVASPPA